MVIVTKLNGGGLRSLPDDPVKCRIICRGKNDRICSQSTDDALPNPISNVGCHLHLVGCNSSGPFQKEGSALLRDFRTNPWSCIDKNPHRTVAERATGVGCAKDKSVRANICAQGSATQSAASRHTEPAWAAYARIGNGVTLGVHRIGGNSAHIGLASIRVWFAEGSD